MGLGGLVKRRPGGTAAGGRATAGRIDLDRVHRRKVDDDTVVARRETGDAMRAPADGNRKVSIRCEPDGSNDITSSSHLNDQERPPVDVPVPNAAGALVKAVFWADDAPLQFRSQLRDRGMAKHVSHVFLLRLTVRHDHDAPGFASALRSRASALVTEILESLLGNGAIDCVRHVLL